MYHKIQEGTKFIITDIAHFSQYYIYKDEYIGKTVEAASDDTIDSIDEEEGRWYCGNLRFKNGKEIVIFGFSMVSTEYASTLDGILGLPEPKELPQTP